MNNISVIGSGTMGNGIAHVFALKGFSVQLIDIRQEALENARKIISNNLDRQVQKQIISPDEKRSALEHLFTTTDLNSGIQQADLVIEAIPESGELKLKIFREIDRGARKDVILASNTSSISITRLAAATGRPEKVIGMHFMNPVPMMRLVEIIRGYKTDTETTQCVMELVKRIGKVPVEVNDYPGFISNRILMPMINEAIYALYEGVAGVEEIDTVMKLGMAHPMGPLQLADFIGLDICLSILQILHNGFGDPKYAPCPLLVNMVEAGDLGRKSGRGFYSYHETSKEIIVADRFRRIR